MKKLQNHHHLLALRLTLHWQTTSELRVGANELGAHIRRVEMGLLLALGIAEANADATAYRRGPRYSLWESEFKVTAETVSKSQLELDREIGQLLKQCLPAAKVLPFRPKKPLSLSLR